MLLITVRPRLAPEQPPSAFTSRDLALTVDAKGLYGFSLEVDGRLVAGESYLPVQDDDARRLEAGVRARSRLDSLLGDRFLLLVVIDPQKEVATIAHSVANWRTY